MRYVQSVVFDFKCADKFVAVQFIAIFSSSKDDELEKVDEAEPAIPEALQPEVADAPAQLAGVERNGVRFDFSLPTSDTASSVLPLMIRQGQLAHTCYWTEKSNVNYILQTLYAEE